MKKITDEQIKKWVIANERDFSSDVFNVIHNFINDVVNAEQREPYSIGQTFTMPDDVPEVGGMLMKVVAYDMASQKHEHEWFCWDDTWEHVYPNYAYFKRCYKAIPVDSRYWTGEISGVKVRAYEDVYGQTVIIYEHGIAHIIVNDIGSIDDKLWLTAIKDAGIRVMPWAVHELLGLDGFPKPEEE